MYYVYILFSEKHDRFYIGHTSSIEIRLNQHNNGLNPSTSAYLPWILMGFVIKPDKSSAYKLEMKLKNLSKERKRAFVEKHMR